MNAASDVEALSSVFSDPAQSVHDRVVAGDALRYTLVRDEKYAEGEEIAASIIRLGIPASDDREIYDALERAYITLAPNDFHSYLIALEWNRPAKERFYQPRMKVLRQVVDAITGMFVRDEYDLLEVSMPPRVGKTSLGIFALGWFAGRKPDSPILATGYAQSITKMFHTGVNSTYEDSQYKYRAIFPLMNLINTSAEDLTLDFRADGKTAKRKYPTVTCRAIDGSLTGATEARHVLYVDDLVRDIEEALSIPRLNMLYDKLVSNAQSRKKEGCKEIHIGTHWSLHDPMSRLEAENEGNPRCKVIRLPALDPETDESNFDYPYGIGFSTEYYRALRQRYEDNNDLVTWECVYQQNPIEREGLLFPADELSWFYDMPDVEHNPPDDIFAFCDVAFGGNDFLSYPIAYQWGDDPPMIVDVVFLKGDYTITEPMVSGVTLHHRIARAVFEANNGGDFYSRDVADLVKAGGHQMNLVAMRAPSNTAKGVRIQQHAPAIKSFVFRHPSTASPMYRQFINHLTTYTINGKNQNDDAPDSLAGLATMLRTNLNASIKVFDRRHI